MHTDKILLKSVRYKVLQIFFHLKKCFPLMMIVYFKDLVLNLDFKMLVYCHSTYNIIISQARIVFIGHTSL